MAGAKGHHGHGHGHGHNKRDAGSGDDNSDAAANTYVIAITGGTDEGRDKGRRRRRRGSSGASGGGSGGVGGAAEYYADDEEEELKASSSMGLVGSSSWTEIKEDGDAGDGRMAPSGAPRQSNIELTDRDGEAGEGGGAANGAAGSAEGGRGVGGGGAGGGGDAPRYKVYKRRWFGLVQLTLLNIIVSWDWLTFSPVASSAASYFATSESTINWLSTAFLFAFVVASPATVYALHHGPRPSIVTASVLVLVGNWVRYGGARAADPAAGFGVVMFGQILTGLAQPFVLAAPARYSDLWFTNQGRVAATALTSLANPFGAALGQLIVPLWVGSSADIPNMVLYVAIISSVCTIPSFFVPGKPPTPAAPSGETPKAGVRESIHVLMHSLEFWLIFVPFAVYVGFFNSVSSLLSQILQPYGYSDDEAGIAGALLIVVGLVTAAATSPVLDRTKAFLVAVKVCVPVIGLAYLVFIWMPRTHDSGGLAGPYVVLSVLGAASFALVPVAVELLVEVSHPVSPEVTSTLGWSGGQLLGGCFILISDALRDNGPGAHPPGNMDRALVFTAVVALAVVPLPMCLGWFGRRDKVSLRRVRSDQLASARESSSGMENDGDGVEGV